MSEPSKFLIACENQDEVSFLIRCRRHYRNGLDWDKLKHSYIVLEDDTLLHRVDVPEEVKPIETKEFVSEVTELTPEIVLETVNGATHPMVTPRPARKKVATPALSAKGKMVLSALRSLNNHPVREKVLGLLVENEAGLSRVDFEKHGIDFAKFNSAMTHFGRGMNKYFAGRTTDRPIRELIEVAENGYVFTPHGREAAIAFLGH